MKNLLKKLLRRAHLHFQLSLVDKSKPRAFYLMGLDNKFPNLGDQAQAAAIPLWIKKHFGMPIVQVKTNDLTDCLDLLKKHITQKDLVFMHSGGNFGDDWYDTQLLRENTFKELIDNRIIQLPQTIFYRESDSGKAKLATSQALIQQMKNLIIFGRDIKSADFSSNFFPNVKTIAMPDMVLSFHEVVEESGMIKVNRPKIKKVLLIMRNDKEGVFDNETKQSILKMLKQASFDCKLWDTDVIDSFPDNLKLKKILNYLQFINQFDLVITDRYHGLIFSVLLKLPTIVMKTHNHKLTSAFDWFDEVNFTKKIETLEDILPTIELLNEIKSFKAPHWNNKHFDLMAFEIKRHFNLDNILD